MPAPQFARMEAEARLEGFGWIDVVGHKEVPGRPELFATTRTFLDDLPFYDRELVYRKTHLGRFPLRSFMSSRGCPYQCTYCSAPNMWEPRWIPRDPKKVVDEIEYIVGNFPGAKAIFFEDDTFTALKKRCIEISDEILRRGIRISWTTNARADLDFETMKAMKAAGCRCLCVGFESGSQMLLDNIKKGIRTEKMMQFMADAKKAGILIHGCFMIGHPGETKETMRETLALAKKLNPDTAQFYPIMVYPGTEAYEWYKERGLILTDDFSKWLTPGGLVAALLVVHRPAFWLGLAHRVLSRVLPERVAARAVGLHRAMYVVPALQLLVGMVLYAGSRTVVRDRQKLQTWMEAEAVASRQ